MRASRAERPRPFPEQVLDRGIAAAQIGNFVMSLSILQDAYANPLQAPAKGLSYYALSLAVVERKYKRAADLCRGAIHMEPECPDHYLNLAKVLLAAGRRRRAVVAMDEGLKMLPGDPSLLRVREQIGIRSNSPIPFLPRNHPINKGWGRARYRRRKRTERRQLHTLQEQGLLPPDRYFDALGLTVGATAEEIDRKYKELRRRLSLDPAFDEALEKIARAYNVLVAFHRRQLEASPPAESDRGAGKGETSSCPAPILRAYEQFGLNPATSYGTVVAVYQGMVRRLQYEGSDEKLEPYAKAFHLIRKYVETQTVPAEPAEKQAFDPDSTLNSTAIRDPLRHYLKILDLPPTATFKQVKGGFAMLCEGFSEPRDDAEQKRQQRIRRAYSIILRVFDERSHSVTVQKKRRLAGVGLIVLMLLLAVIAGMNLGTLRRLTVGYEPGDLIYKKGDSSPFGTMVAFDPTHRFATGPAVPAYQVELRGSGQKIWISQRAVIGGMRPGPDQTGQTIVAPAKQPATAEEPSSTVR